MRDFKDLLLEVQAKTEAANRPISSDPRTYSVQLGKARRAQEDLKALFETYKREVMSRAVFIIPYGDNKDEFAKIAEEEFGCFQGNVDKLYEDITQEISPVLYTNSSASPSLLDILQDQFQSVADEIGLLEYPMVIYKSKYSRSLNSKEDLIAFTRQAFNEDLGLEVVGYYVVHYVSKKAIEDSFSGRIVPIIINSSDEKLNRALIDGLKKVNPHVYAADARGEMTVEVVEAALQDIKKKTKN